MIEEKKELKPTTYRLDETTKEKFKQIANDIGCNQDDTMNVLINAYFLQNKQVELSEHKSEIDKFQSYITSIATMYTNALQANHDTKELVKTEFNALLESKDSLINDLQQKVKNLQQEQNKNFDTVKTLEQKNIALNEQIATLTQQLQEYSERLKEQKESNLLLKNNLDTTKSDNISLRNQLKKLVGYDI